jgi:hypothetical protein
MPLARMMLSSSPALLLEAAHVRLAALVQDGMRWLDHVHHISPCRLERGLSEIPSG